MYLHWYCGLRNQLCLLGCAVGDSGSAAQLFIYTLAPCLLLQVPGDKLHAIYAASFAPTGVSYPLVWDQGWDQPGIDVTQAYLDAEP